MSIRADAVAHCLEHLQRGQRLALYGCGQLAKMLLAAYPVSLERHRIVFLSSHPTVDAVMNGYPVIDPASLAPGETDYVLILSESYEREMLQSVGFVGTDRILLLSDMMRIYALNIPPSTVR